MNKPARMRNLAYAITFADEPDDTLRLVVEDDCSRFCLGILRRKSLTTPVVTEFLDGIIAVYGKPRQILTDHGSIYRKRFDKWCRWKGIEHIRSRVNKPTSAKRHIRTAAGSTLFTFILSRSAHAAGTIIRASRPTNRRVRSTASGIRSYGTIRLNF